VRAITVEVRLIVVSAVIAALESNGSFNGFARRCRCRCTCLRSASTFAAAHLCALFAQDGFTGQLHAVAFNGQHFNQHLVAFMQFVFHILHAMFRDL
jgi:hypothetical protein